MLFSIDLPATVYPTVEIEERDWQDALERLRAGEAPSLQGWLGGDGCRGGKLQSATCVLKLLAEGPTDFEVQFISGWIAPLLEEGKTKIVTR
jgi:hypothetical protein